MASSEAMSAADYIKHHLQSLTSLSDVTQGQGLNDVAAAAEVAPDRETSGDRDYGSLFCGIHRRAGDRTLGIGDFLRYVPGACSRGEGIRPSSLNNQGLMEIAGCSRFF